MSTKDSWTHLSDISPDDASFDIHKFTSSKISELYQLESDQGFTGFVSGERFVSFYSFGAKINECGNWLKFVRLSGGKIKLSDARFCKSPNCPMCQWRRSLKWRSKFLSLLPTLQQQYPKHRWLFLTLTVKNCQMSELKSTIKTLNDSFNRLSKLSKFPFEGYIKSIEVTRVWECWDEQGNYLGEHGTRWITQWEYKAREKLTVKPTDLVHPHLHIAGMVKASYFTNRAYLSHSAWTELWKQSLRVDYTPIVNVKAVKAKKLPPKPQDLADDASNDESGMVQAICEVCKYTVKEADLIGEMYNEEDADQVNSEWLKALTEQLYRCRRVEYRGLLKEIGKQIEEAENGDLIKTSEEDSKDNEAIEEEFLSLWNQAIKKYIVNKTC